MTALSVRRRRKESREQGGGDTGDPKKTLTLGTDRLMLIYQGRAWF